MDLGDLAVELAISFHWQLVLEIDMAYFLCFCNTKVLSAILEDEVLAIFIQRFQSQVKYY